MQFSSQVLSKFQTLPVRTLSPFLALALASGAFAVTFDEPCIPEGGSGEVEFDRPDLEGEGMPTDAEWIEPQGAPEAFDVDTWSGDDSLGQASTPPGGESASVSITNSGGTLFGPNGHDVEGGLEGDCLEVILVWTYRYKVNITVGHSTSYTLAPEGVGGGTGSTTLEQHSVWRYGTVVQGPAKVCPC